MNQEFNVQNASKVLIFLFKKFDDVIFLSILAPNSYNIPETIGGYDNVHYQAPKYTMGGKEGDIWTTNKNPGPGSYNVTETDKLKQKAPAYSISQKTNIPTDKSKKPGPGAHSPEKVSNNRNIHLSYSFDYFVNSCPMLYDAILINQNRQNLLF
ncbi:UNVERIFIED_CONTAM: Odf3 [Trichonephila clavipes]